MQTPRKRRKGQKRPQLDPNASKNGFDQYLNIQDSTQYVEKLQIDESRNHGLSKELYLLRNVLNNHAKEINEILEIYNGKNVKTKWLSGLKQFQNAVNQLNQMQLDSDQLTKEQLLQAKQIFEAFNKQYKSSFSPKNLGWGEGQQQQLMDYDLETLIYELQAPIEETSNKIFGVEIRSSFLRRRAGTYIRQSQDYYINKYKQRLKNISDKDVSIPWGEIFAIVNVHPPGKTKSGVDRSMLHAIDVQQRKVEKRYQDRQRKEQAKQHQKAILQGLDEAQANRAGLQQLISSSYGQNSSMDKVIDQMIQHENLVQYNHYVSNNDIQIALAYQWYSTDVYIATGMYQPIISKSALAELKRGIRDLINRNNSIQSIIHSISSLQSVGEKMITSLQKATNQMSIGEEFTGLFDDLLELPIRQVNAVLSLSSKALLVAEVGINSSVGTFVSFVGNVMGSISGKKRNDKSKDNDDTPDIVDSITNISTQIINTFVSVIKIFTQGFQIIQGVISQGIESFISVFSAMMSLLKKILATSKTIDQILNILNLQMAIFFLPFNLIFGNHLFLALNSFIQWMVSEYGGLAFVNTVRTYLDLQTPIVECIDEIMTFISGWVTPFTDFFVNLQIMFTGEINKVLKHFAIFMKEGSGGESFIKMCEKGLELANVLLEEDIIGLFLSFGNACMMFLYQNKDKIYSVLNLSFKMLTKQLLYLGKILDFVESFCVEIGMVIGQFAGFIINGLWMVGGIGGLRQAFQIFGKYVASIGLLETALTKSGILSVVLGGASGQAIGYAIKENFFSFKKGGYIPATPGGQLIIVAEKETEYIIPESKMHLIRGHNNILLEINGDVFGINGQSEIIGAIDSQSNRQRFRR